MQIEIITEKGLPDINQDPQWWIDTILTDLFFLCKVVLHHKKKKEYRDLNWIHVELCEFLTENPIDQLLVLMFRDSLKSSIARGMVIQWFLQKAYFREDGKAFIYSGISDLAEDHLNRIWKEILKNKIIQTLFYKYVPHKKQEFESCSKDSGIRYNGIEIDIGSPEKSLTGHHYELGINDNLVNEVNAQTEERRKKIVQRWRQQEAILAEDAREVIFETTWYQDDLAGIILEPDGRFNFNKIRRKACYQFISDTGYAVFSCPCRDEKGDPVFPEKVDDKYLLRKRNKMGSYLYSALYELQPVAEEDMIFRPSWIQKYEKLPDNFVRNMVVDCAGTKKKESSHSAISIGDWDEQGKLYISLAEKKKLTPLELRDWIIKTYDNSRDQGRPITWVGIEEEKFGIFLKDVLNAKRPDIIVIPISIRSMPRPTRMSELVPKFENGIILSKPGLNDYESEVTTYYRDKVKDTDILDTIYYHFRIQLLPRPAPKKREGIEPVVPSDFVEQIKRERASYNNAKQNIAATF